MSKCAVNCSCGRHTISDYRLQILRANGFLPKGSSAGHPCKPECECKRHDFDELHRQRIGQSKLGVARPDVTERNLRRVTARELPYKDTKPELEMAKRFTAANIVFEMQKWIGRMVVDFYLPVMNLVVEVDGCWWHGCREHCPTSHKVDNFEDRKQSLNSLGYGAIRIWEHELV